jgi:hypothetical protein
MLVDQSTASLAIKRAWRNDLGDGGSDEGAGTGRQGRSGAGGG